MSAWAVIDGVKVRILAVVLAIDPDGLETLTIKATCGAANAEHLPDPRGGLRSVNVSAIGELDNAGEWLLDALASEVAGHDNVVADIVLRRTRQTVVTLLDPTGNDDAERAAIADAPRPGTWFGDAHADGRALTQDQTDLLIRAELFFSMPFTATRSQEIELRGIVGHPRCLELEVGIRRTVVRAHRQRGGIDSDPLVRLLAFRTWGDRDRRWFDGIPNVMLEEQGT